AQGGSSMSAVTERREVEGVAAFAQSYDSLLGTVAARREAVLVGERGDIALGRASGRVEVAVREMDEARVGARLWQRDATLWKAEDPKHQAEIANRFGWLALVERMETRIAELEAFAAEVRRDGFQRALVCGMGGSSLAPEVLRRAFGVAKGCTDVALLDSTDPAAVRNAAAWSDPAHTLYLISSKSGTTTEPNAFFRFFWERVRATKGDRAGENFVAITDPDTSLEKEGKERGRRGSSPSRPARKAPGSCPSTASRSHGRRPTGRIASSSTSASGRATTGPSGRSCAPGIRWSRSASPTPTTSAASSCAGRSR